MIAQHEKAILQSLDVDDVVHFADINFGAPELAIALYKRYGCKIDVLTVDDKCRFIEADKASTKAYTDLLVKSGVDKAAIHIVDHRKTLKTYDVLASVDNFGTKYKIKFIDKLLNKSLHAMSRVVLTIKKGSGSYPFLNQFGGCNTIALPTSNTFGLVILSIEPSSEPDQEWSSIAKELAGKDGFFTDCGEHSFLYIPRGKTLVVTFDNLDIAMTKRDTRRPWGFEFIEGQNWSMLGVMANGWTWFRDPAVTAEFDRLKESGFFEQFDRVVFYGASMGGYAAAAFSSAAKGATVFAISPQSTVDKSIVPWEMRYKTVWQRDFTGPYGDAALVSDDAQTVHIMYDPYVQSDAAHAARFKGKNVKFWRCPHLGHRLGSSLSQMGILNQIASECINGNLDNKMFYGLLRKRRGFARYLRELSNLALEKNHIGLATRVSEFTARQGYGKLSRQIIGRIKSLKSASKD
ncbi:MAG: hypothetical protein JKX71_05295 [Amylibacter sp.]|nr:hypothetical protein [Amylibacter sp.]